MGVASLARTKYLDSSRLKKSKRYNKFCVYYRYNFLQFILDHFSESPTHQQLPIILGMSEPNFRETASSGHSTGKTRLIAWYIVWQITVFPDSTILLNSGKIDQMRTTLWRELDDVLDEFFIKRPWLKPYFIKQSKSFFAVGKKEGWAAFMGTAAKGQEGNLAGQHRKKHTVIVDEAASLTEELMGILEGSLTSPEDNSLAMFGQGLTAHGPFYDSHHSLKHLYNPPRALDSEFSPLVSKAWVERMLLRYDGFFSDDYQVKVKGGFPTRMEGYLIPRAWAMDCGNLKIEHDEAPGIVIAVDVAGPGRNNTVYLVAEVSGYHEERKLITRELIIKKGVSEAPVIVADLDALYKKYRHLNPTVGVDADGGGHYVCGFVEKANIPITRIHWGSKALEDDRFGNERAEWAFWARLAVQYNRITFKGLPRVIKERVYDEFGKIPYRRTDKGLYLWSKDQMKKVKGIESPDIFDVYCFALALPYVSMGIDLAEDFRHAAARAEAENFFSRLDKHTKEAAKKAGKTGKELSRLKQAA